MTANFEKLATPTTPRIPLIVHVPHSATTIPPEYRQDFLLSNEELAREVLLMTDHYTNDLAHSAIPMGGTVFCNLVSRLVMDPERFPDDSDEPMARLGMGAVYISRQDGAPLRGRGFSPRQRKSVMEALYVPYHAAFERLVERTLTKFGVCFIVDCHSYPRHALPYEDARLPRPQVCIGYSDAHADEPIVRRWQSVVERAGLSVGINTPFSGSFVPGRYYLRERRVRSLMVELRRDLYIDELTAEKNSGFEAAQCLLKDLLSVVVLRLSDLTATAIV